MIRKAVGIIIYKKNKFLLVHKIKMSDAKAGPEQIKGEWDFVKGGVKSYENDILQTVIRELKEETGTDKYKIIKEFKNKIKFDFPPKIAEKIGFESQETRMFLVEYIGNEEELKCDKDEIDQLKFYDKEEIFEKLAHKESKEFFKENVLKEN